MSESKYRLTAAEKENFHRDDVRAEIRLRVAREFCVSQTVHIVDDSGDVWDVLNGSQPDATSEAEPTPEEIQAQKEKEAHADYLEKEIRPLVYKRLRIESRDEFRVQLRDKTNEVLELRAKVATLELENARLKAKLAKLSKSSPQPSTEQREATPNPGSGS